MTKSNDVLHNRITQHVLQMNNNKNNTTQ